MGRGRRICYPGAFFHCLNRGNRREKIFQDDEDYHQMLECLGGACERYRVLIHGFCLMPNHFHILLQQEARPVSSAMRSLETRYATYFNRKYRQTGHVFQGRFRGLLCDKQTYLLSLIRYIHLNPVRAELVQKPQEWPWSSLSAYLGLSACAWLYKKEVMAMFGRRPRQRLLEFLSQAPGLTREQIYPDEGLSILGSQEFIAQVAKQGEPRRVRQRVYTGGKLSMQELSERVCRAAGLTVAQIRRKGKGAQRETEVRERLIHTATRVMFYRVAEVARYLGLTTSAITHANHRFESRLRRNPELSAEILSTLMDKS